MPGACAPSTSVSTPRAASSATSSSSGKTSAVADVTWSSTARRVRGVTAARTRSRTSSGPAVGNGMPTVTTCAPDCTATAAMALRQALYS